MMNFLLVLSIIGILTSTMYALLVTIGALRLAQRRRALPPSSFAPPVSLLKPLHGSEPDLEAHLESFFEQDYPEFEVIFCARSDQDPGLEIARRVASPNGTPSLRKSLAFILRRKARTGFHSRPGRTTSKPASMAALAPILSSRSRWNLIWLPHWIDVVCI